MNAVLFTSSGVFAPMRELLRRFSVSRRSPPRPAAVVRSKAWRADGPALAPFAAPMSHHSPPHVALARVRSSLPLRVIRVVDGDRPTQHAGRMRISGRMADVCAELDRMAAREAQALTPAR